MDLHQLQAFDQVMQQQSFSKAARRLGISQPTISLRIQALEQELGDTLFVRGGRQLQLTELGRNFVPHARQALAAMNAGLEAAQHTIQGKKGQLMLATSPTCSTGFFASTLARLRQAHPGLDIAVHTGHNQQIVEMLHDGFVELGIVVGPFFSPALYPIVQLKEPLIVIAHANHPLSQQQQVTLEDLQVGSRPFFQIDWNLDARYWQRNIQASQFASIEVPPHTAYDLLMSGIGAALMTRSFAHHGLQAGILVELPIPDLPAMQRECVLLRHERGKSLSPAANEFICILREETRLL
ncbi:putative HTH-type transcriptional regulator YwbI [Dictyobacter vulcani]|uniref:Putative HTH-type transcriptional regulator YwbI n=1 Tax=Dictyobacter vulcani TaxID=2607529 RepID=A0A5J4L0N4_9CHLR|nr:LysR family transcriptional regulator [Dictyobacter vulcani]GER91036.1 putative HTH-type transcriptional regulator YwbI [Dictyobacter vulcani]